MAEHSKPVVSLHWSVLATKPDKVAQLLAEGADVHAIVTNHDARHPYEGNPLHAHAATRHHSYQKEDKSIVALLTHYGCDINASNSRGETPLHLAAKMPRKEPASLSCLRTLISHGAEADARDVYDRNALHMMAADITTPESLLLSCASLLLNAGADINAADASGATPLMLAAQAGHADLYSFLCAKDAEITATDARGRRASDYAREGQHYAMADFLRAKEKEHARRGEGEVTLEDGWIKLDDGKIARHSVEGGIGYKMTEIFNFHARTYICIAQNLDTRTETMVVKTFDDMGHSPLIHAAQSELEKTGALPDHLKTAPRKISDKIPFPKQ